MEDLRPTSSPDLMLGWRYNVYMSKPNNLILNLINIIYLFLDQSSV